MDYYLAIDIGASSGRHILFWKEQNNIYMEEIYRFINCSQEIDGFECWNLPRLVENIKKGMRICYEIGKIPKSMAIDTWGIDFVLTDKFGNVVSDCICYRDKSFEKSMEEVFDKIPKEEIYQHTGIQFQQFNTIYQLYTMKKRMDLKKVSHFLMIPDYLNYVLTGMYHNEYTNASTTQLINAFKKDWDEEILDILQIPRELFHPLIQPGKILGDLQDKVVKEIGYNLTVRACASHDTGSAFLVPEDQDTIILSSGTWSLIGIQLQHPYISVESMNKNYTNEGGFHTIRFLKNIMGLWLLQSLRRDLKSILSFQELCDLGKASKPFDTVINVDDSCFLKPENMMEAIDNYCIMHSLQKPKTIGEYVQCICRSLAVAYNQAIKELETLQQRSYDSITVIGGGVQNEYLNEWIERICHKKVIRGTVEATALGNAMIQMYADQQFVSLEEARSCKLVIHDKLHRGSL